MRLDVEREMVLGRTQAQGENRYTFAGLAQVLAGGPYGAHQNTISVLKRDGDERAVAGGLRFKKSEETAVTSA